MDELTRVNITYLISVIRDYQAMLNLTLKLLPLERASEAMLKTEEAVERELRAIEKWMN